VDIRVVDYVEGHALITAFVSRRSSSKTEIPSNCRNPRRFKEARAKAPFQPVLLEPVMAVRRGNAGGFWSGAINGRS